MKNATLRQLKVFESVARQLSFTRAARELHLTQPAVSTQVKMLEEHAGLLADKDLPLRPQSPATEPLESLSCRGLCFQYGEHRLLDDIGFRLKAGDFLGISGDSGQGKTTLAPGAMRGWTPTCRVSVGGLPLLRLAGPCLAS